MTIVSNATKPITDTERLAANLALQQFSPEAKLILMNIAMSDKPVAVIKQEFLKALPTWEQTAHQLEIVIKYLRAGGGDE